jgi:hypothetical protein
MMSITQQDHDDWTAPLRKLIASLAQTRSPVHECE